MKRHRSELSSAVPVLSVVLPVYNAMPWLPTTMHHLLRQRLEGDQPIEIVAAVDGCTDDSLPFLLELVGALGDAARSEQCDPPYTTGPDSTSNPAFLQPLRAPETVDHPSFSKCHVAAGSLLTRDEGAASDLRAEGDAPSTAAPPSASVVASSCRPEHRLLVLHYGANCGQGAAMSLALSRCRAPLIAQMESDDERPDEQAFARMIAHLRAHPDWDGVSYIVELCGAPDRERMGAYVAWQNSLIDPTAMAAERFVEIPALHQTAIFTRKAIDDVLAPTHGRYRDGPWHEASAANGVAAGRSSSTEEGCDGGARLDHDDAATSSYGNDLDTPVDLWWWLAFFHAGKRCGKLGGPPLFGWRQHPRQHTRTHGRLSIDALRKIKVHFLLRRGGPLDQPRRVILISVGATLSGFESDLKAHPAIAGKEVVCVEWKPPKKADVACTLPKHARRANVSQPTTKDLDGKEGEPDDVVRLWAFGNASVRQRVKDHVRDWEAGRDWCVA